MYIISIDPGISGAICFFENGSVVDVIDMPSMADGKKNKKQVNGSQIYNEKNLKIKNIDKKKNYCCYRTGICNAWTRCDQYV